MSSSSAYSPAPQMGNSPVTTRKSSSTTGFGNYRGSPSTVHTKSIDTKSAKLRSSTVGHVTENPSSNPTHHHRGGLRQFTPSPPSSTHHRGMGAGTGVCGSSSIRNAPYYSPRDSSRGGLRGVGRNSPNSPKDSPRNGGGTLRGVAKSPTHGSPRGDIRSPILQGTESVHGGSSSSETSPNRSPALLRKALVNLNETSPTSKSPSYNLHNSNNDIIASRTGWGSLTPPSPPPTLNTIPLERTLNSYQTSGHNLSRSPSPYEAPPPVHSPPLPSNDPQQSPPHTLDFEDGRVLSQLPYEYSSFLDLPPSALGMVTVCL